VNATVFTFVSGPDSRLPFDDPDRIVVVVSRVSEPHRGVARGLRGLATGDAHLHRHVGVQRSDHERQR
jgi:hypothetical protein